MEWCMRITEIMLGIPTMVPYTVTVVTSVPPYLVSNIHSSPKSNPICCKPKPRRCSNTFRLQTQITHLLQRCQSVDQLSQIHARILKSGRDQDAHSLSKFLRLCSTFRSMNYAAEIFERIDNPDVYHYTALISGVIDVGAYLEAIQLYFKMMSEVIEPDPVVVAYALKACGIGLASREGMQIHGQVLKLKIGADRPVRMKLIEFYGRCGIFLDAEKVFAEMPERDSVAATILISCYSYQGLVEEARAVFKRVDEKDTVCWTAMIDGLIGNGRMNAALELFRDMQRESVRPNEVTTVCVLSACSQLGALELGRWVHSYVGKYNIRENTFVGSALIDMYSKCGSLDEARKVFDEMPDRDVVSYNSMITGFSMHGRSTEAIKLYQQMIRQHITPNSISFAGVLNACSHRGLVDLGFEIFESMAKDYSIEPQIEHYGCMVDLLGRAGQLDEAYDFIKSRMRIEPDHVIWSSLLSACKIHGNLILGEKVAGILMNNDVADSGTYVLLSNVYASFGKWEDAVRMRAKMKQRGIQKEPGCSSIEVNNEIHEFLLGDIRHPQREDIYRKLEELNGILSSEGYSPVKDEVLQDIEKGAKDWALTIHSERLAICYGLISTKPRTTIRVVKNLRVCSDCHSMIKIVSKVTKRKIVVRDRNRFHHFEYGSCSCGDYW